MNNITIMPDGPKADERAERAKAESQFAARLFKILLEVQADSVRDLADPVTPGGLELNQRFTRVYDEIWNAAFATVSAKRKKKEEKQHV